ncbi:MAG TPA: hypothetical protein VM008_04925 [Phycisphaerae bacterium]|nr:hypothetical protein [Phycisphaerae bacterium]
MNFSLRPETQRFIDEQIKTGRFPSPEAVIEAAVAEMRDLDAELDDAAVDAINDAEEQADRGEGMELNAFRAHIAKRFRAG